ncbi:hypothetical protein V3M44_06255 [Trueperella pyogenes]|uniref:hypothetical protein n=1 Tax=Trueperella pyogenes TaxID=1661 RepID=UPI00345D8A3E
MTSSTHDRESAYSLLDQVFDRENPARPSADTRPPLIWAAIGAFYAALIALGVSFGPLATAVVVLMMAGSVIPGWPVLFGLTNRGVSRVVMSLTLLAALPAAYCGSLVATTFVATLSIMASFVGEMMRRDGRIHLVEHISASAGGAMLMVAASLWIHVAGAWNGETHALPDPGTYVGLVTAVAIAAAATIHGYDSDHANILGLVNAIFVGLVAAFLLGGAVWMGGVIGVVVGILYAFLRRAMRMFERPLTWVQGVVKAILPHCALGVIGYVFTLILL